MSFRYKIVKVDGKYAIAKWCLFFYMYRDLDGFRNGRFESDDFWWSKDHRHFSSACCRDDLILVHAAYLELTKSTGMNILRSMWAAMVSFCKTVLNKGSANISLMSKTDIAWELMQKNNNTASDTNDSAI